MYLVHPHSQHEMFILFDQPLFLSTIFLTLISLELHSTQLPFTVLINSCSIKKLITIKWSSDKSVAAEIGRIFSFLILDEWFSLYLLALFSSALFNVFTVPFLYTDFPRKLFSLNYNLFSFNPFYLKWGSAVDLSSKLLARSKTAL